MVQWLLLLVLTPSLLLPPGVCVCHLLDEGRLSVVTTNPHLITPAPTTATVADLAPVEDPADHPPGCPVRKHTDGQCLLQLLIWDLPVVAVDMLPVDTLPQPVASAASAEPRTLDSCWLAADSPLYLTLRALLI
jgi:hypothetical protein